MTEITGMRNTRYNFIFHLIIDNPGATVSINDIIDDRSLSNSYSDNTIINYGTISNETDHNHATLSHGTQTPASSLSLL